MRLINLQLANVAGARLLIMQRELPGTRLESKLRIDFGEEVIKAPSRERYMDL